MYNGILPQISCSELHNEEWNHFKLFQVPLERGVRQGDPLSPYLFIVVVEPLAIAIRQNQGIRRIRIENKETKILQYVDETTAVLSDISSAEQLFELLDFFKDVSGLTNNCKKRRVCGLGRPKKVKQKLLESDGLMSR